MNGSVTQFYRPQQLQLNNVQNHLTDFAPSHYLSLLYFTTAAAMFQLGLRDKKWEC